MSYLSPRLRGELKVRMRLETASRIKEQPISINQFHFVWSLKQLYITEKNNKTQDCSYCICTPIQTRGANKRDT